MGPLSTWFCFLIPFLHFWGVVIFFSTLSYCTLVILLLVYAHQHSSTTFIHISLCISLRFSWFQHLCSLSFAHSSYHIYRLYFSVFPLVSDSTISFFRSIRCRSWLELVPTCTLLIDVLTHNNSNQNSELKITALRNYFSAYIRVRTIRRTG